MPDSKRKKYLKMHFIWIEKEIQDTIELRKFINKSNEQEKINISHHLSLENIFMLKRNYNACFANFIYQKLIEDKDKFDKILREISKIVIDSFMNEKKVKKSMQKIRICFLVYLLFIFNNVIICAQDFPTIETDHVVPNIGVSENNTSYLTDWVSKGIYNYHEDTFLTEEGKSLSTECTIVENLEDITEVEFLRKPLYDLFLQQANTILKETDISLQIKTDYHSLLSNRRTIQYYQYLWENSISWQMETYYTLLDQRMRFYKKEQKDEFLKIPANRSDTSRSLDSISLYTIPGESSSW